NVIFVVGLDPPLRQGQTRYPFLVFQFAREEELEIELNVAIVIYTVFLSELWLWEFNIFKSRSRICKNSCLKDLQRFLLSIIDFYFKEPIVTPRERQRL
ncbi:MAG: hypothetical protein EOO89_05170, partial [Pedobacter sp.]